MTLGRVALLAFAAVALDGCAAASKGFVCPSRGGPRWREVTSEHVVLRTDLDSQAAAEMVRELELDYALLGKAMSDRRADVTQRIEVIAFRTKEEFIESTGRDEHKVGYVHHDAFGQAWIVIAGGLGEEQGMIVAHEMAHMLLRHAVIRQPRWFEEGVAVYYETLGSPPEGKPRAAGALLASRYLSHVRAGPARTRDVLTWTSAPHEDRLYATSGLLVHFLKTKRSAQFAAFQERLARAEDPRQAWNAVFPEWAAQQDGGNEDLDVVLRHYSKEQGWAALTVEASVSVHISERPLAPADTHGIRLRLSRRWDEGEWEEEVQEALREDPGHVRALREKARSDWEIAPALARRAVAAHPEDPWAWDLLADTLASRERERALRKAVELAPGQASHLLELVDHLDSRRTEEALQLSQRAVELAPWSRFAVHAHAVVLARSGRCEEAISTMKRAVELFRDEMSTSSAAGAQARLARMEATCGLPSAREAEALAGDAQRAARDHDGEAAAGLLTRTVALDPGYLDGWLLLGSVTLQLGRITDAARAFEMAIAIDAARAAWAWTALGTARQAQGKPAEAEAAFRRHIELEPRNANAPLALGRLLLAQKRGREALVELEQAVFLAPRSARALVALATGYIARGELELAMPALERAAEISPKPSTWNDAAYALADADVNLERAGAWAEAAVAGQVERLNDQASRPGVFEASITRSLFNAWDTLGWVRFRQGRLADAERYMAAAERNAAMPGVSDHLGQILERRGRHEEAAAAFARALAASPREREETRRRLDALAGARADALVAVARAELARRGVISAPASVEVTPAQGLVRLVLAADGTVSNVVAAGDASLPAGAEALRGARHGLAFPDARASFLVVDARYRCSADGCGAVIGDRLLQ